jgi:hypothetical protein
VAISEPNRNTTDEKCSHIISTAREPEAPNEFAVPAWAKIKSEEKPSGRKEHRCSHASAKRVMKMHLYIRQPLYKGGKPNREYHQSESLHQSCRTSVRIVSCITVTQRSKSSSLMSWKLN